MEHLFQAIRTTPIIDNHAHPLLKPEAQSKYPLLSITTEAHGDALKATTSSLPHIRAVRQLAAVLGCEETWEAVKCAIETENRKPDNAWEKRCFEGIETVLIDDGLDCDEDVFDFDWHDRLTKSPCKLIVRIERVAEEIIRDLRKSSDKKFASFAADFENEIKDAISDHDIVGFKSVICYRTGLAIPTNIDLHDVESAYQRHFENRSTDGNPVQRLDGTILNAYLVHKTAQLIQDVPAIFKKPFQFHTGLGDNDITLTRSSPSHLQQFIKLYPTVPIVLLHASYPWTKEAGYLASVYDNVYADIGEVFPMVSREGQENVLREILELCPSEKILWSTDGHWFPETYLLAVVQVREALEKVIPDYVSSKDLSIQQAITIVQDLLFNTSNKLYSLGLQLHDRAPSIPPASNILSMPSIKVSDKPKPDVDVLRSFLSANPEVKYMRLQYLDYTATVRARVFPIERVLKLLQKHGHFSASITMASLGLLQNDCVFPNAGTIASSGEYQLLAIFSSIRAGPVNGYASVAAEFIEQDRSNSNLCPRFNLNRAVSHARHEGLELLVGFEIEVVFVEYDQNARAYKASARLGRGHSWGSAQALNSPLALQLLDEICDALAHAGIHLEYFHPESAQTQYEFILPPLPPLEAVDTLIQARQIIVATASKHDLRATLIPKPFPMQPGTAAHVHISLVEQRNSENGKDKDPVQRYQSFYAGILKHLPAILAFTYSQSASYKRMLDSCWAGGTWVSWGKQNRETALRQIEGSHWEVKVLDGLANPYLVMTAIIFAGWLGVSNREALSIQACQFDPGTLSVADRERLGIVTKLPKDLYSSLTALNEDRQLVDMIGLGVVERYLKVKMAEAKLLDSMGENEKRNWIIDRY